MYGPYDVSFAHSYDVRIAKNEMRFLTRLDDNHISIARTCSNMSTVDWIKESLSMNARVVWLSSPDELHQMCLIPFDVFAKMPIRRWKHNRPADKERVAEICEFMRASKRVDGLIYLAGIGQDLVCYESNHRREALEGIARDGIADFRPILVDVIWNASDELITTEFFRLNKAVSVPDLYIAPTDVGDGVGINAYDRVQQLIAARDLFCSKYSAVKVTTNNPHRPNFNSDKLLDDLARVSNSNKISIPEMMSRLDLLNAKLARSDHSKLAQKVINKCEKSGCWLFAVNSRLNPDDIASTDDIAAADDVAAAAGGIM